MSGSKFAKDSPEPPSSSSLKFIFVIFFSSFLKLCSPDDTASLSAPENKYGLYASDVESVPVYGDGGGDENDDDDDGDSAWYRFRVFDCLGGLVIINLLLVS